MADVIIGVVIIGLVACVVGKKRRDKKAGRSSCGCNCSGCPSKGSCHE